MFVGITEDKMKHILGVAEKCYTIAKQQGRADMECRKAYICGFLHDIGYRFSENCIEHPTVGADMSKLIDDDVLYAISNHGDPDAEGAWLLDVLNKADLTIDHKGNKVTFEERVKSIGDRYGADSEQYNKAKKMAKNMFKGNRTTEMLIMNKDAIEVLNDAVINKNIVVIGQTWLGKTTLMKYIKSVSDKSGIKTWDLNCATVTKDKFTELLADMVLAQLGNKKSKLMMDEFSIGYTKQDILESLQRFYFTQPDISWSVSINGADKVYDALNKAEASVRHICKDYKDVLVIHVRKESSDQTGMIMQIYENNRLICKSDVEFA